MKIRGVEIYDDELRPVGRTFAVKGAFFNWDGQDYMIGENGEVFVKSKWGLTPAFGISAMILEVE